MTPLSNISTYEYPVVGNFSPEVTVEIYGLASNTRKVIAIIDTGFTGFLQIPTSIGISSNLTLWSTGFSILADGSKIKNLMCVGKIRFAERDIFGIIILSDTGTDCLLGMQFLQSVGMDFTVSTKRKRVVFTEEVKVEAAAVQVSTLAPTQISPETPIQAGQPPNVTGQRVKKSRIIKQKNS